MRDWLAKFFGFNRPETTTGQKTGPSDRDIAYHLTRKIAHECGHTVLAYLSPAVYYVEGITFLDDGSAEASVRPRKSHPDYLLENAIICLGGLAGEALIWSKIRNSGFSEDFRMACDVLSKYLESSSSTELEKRWNGLLSKSRLDVASLLETRPTAEMSAALNLCYRRAGRKLMDNRAGFDRLIALATAKGNLTRDDIASQFGPRIWVPSQWR